MDMQKQEVKKVQLENLMLNTTGGVAIITINRPQALNALNKNTIHDLDQLIDLVAVSDEVRIVIITGGEENFAAGADINEMVSGDPQWAKGFSFKDTFNKLENIKQPVIAAMAGYALGAGLELAMACDLRIAKRNAKMGMPEISLGIFPGAGGTQRLPRTIGVSRAKEMIYTGRIIDADTAMNFGLINKIVEENVENEALLLAAKLQKLPPLALQSVKHVINYGLRMDISAGIEMEAVAWANLFSTKDQKEGMEAFLNKRKPVYTGK
jgi:enoyl-CoA hydratase